MALTTRQAYGLHGDGVMFPPLRWRQSSGSEVTEGSSNIFETDKVQLKRNCTDFVVFEVDSDGVLVGCGPTHANNEDASSGLVGRWASYAHPHTAPSVRKALRGVAKAAASNAAALKVSTDKGSSTLMSDGNEMQNKRYDEAEDLSKAVEESLLKVFEERGLPLVFDALTSSSPLSSVSSSAFTTTSTPPPPLPLDAIFPCFCGILASGSKAGGALPTTHQSDDACVCGMETLRTKVRDYAFAVLVAGHREHTRGACADEESAEEHNSRVRHHNEVLGLWAKTLLTSAEDYDLFCSRQGMHGGKASTNTSPSTEESTSGDFSPAVRAGLPLASFNDKYARTFIRIAMRYRYPFLDCHTFNVVGGAPAAATTAGVGPNGTDGGERLTLLPSSTFFEHCALFGAPHPHDHSSYSSTGTAPLGQAGPSVGGLGGASSAASKTIVAALEGITRLTRVSLLMTVPPYLLLGLPEKFQGKKGSSSSSYRSSSSSPTANGGDSVSNTALTAPHRSQQKANAEEIKVNSKQGTESKTSVLDAINDELSYWLGGGGGGSSNGRSTSSSAGSVKQNNTLNEVPVTAVAVGSSDILTTSSQQTTTAHSANIDARTASWYCLAHPERTAAVTAAVGNLSNFRTFPPINLSFAPEATKDSRAIFHEGCRKIYGVGWRKSVANSVLSLSVDRSALQRLLSRPTAVDGGDGENRKRPREQQEAESEEKVKAANTASNNESTEAGDNKVHTTEKDKNRILADPTQQVYTHFLAIKCNLDFLKMSDALAEALTYFNAAPIPDPKGRSNTVSSSYTPPSRGEEVLPSAITIAGIKDKAAVTAQRISVRGDYTRTTRTFADSVLEKAMGNKRVVSGIGIDWSLRHAMVTKSESFTTADDLAVKMATFRSEAIQKAAPIIAAMMKGSESSTTQSTNNTTTVASNIEAGTGDRNHTHIDADVDDVVKSLERAMLDDPTVQLVYYDVPSSHYPITSSSSLSLSAEAAEDNDNDNPTTSNPPTSTSEPAWLLLTHPTTRAYPIALGDLKGNRFMIRAEVSGKRKEKRGGGGELVDVVGAPVAELQNRCAVMHTLASAGSSNDVNEEGPHHTLASPPISSSSSSSSSLSVVAFPNHFGTQRFGIVMGSVLGDDHTIGDTHTSPSLDDARAKGANKEEDAKSQMAKSAPQGSSSSSSLVSLFSCRSEEYLSELTKHTGIYILQGDYSRAVDSLLFYGAILGGGRDACEGKGSPRSTLIDKLQSYLLLTGNFQLIATNSRFPDPESLVEAYTRMYANESVRRLVAVAEAIKGAVSNTTNTNTSEEKSGAGDPSLLLTPNEWSSMLCTPFTPSSASSAQLRYVRCHNLASTYRDASFIITRLCNAIKGARLAGGSGSSKGDFNKIEVGGGQSALPSPFIGSSEGALAFRENGHVWAGICQKAIMAIPFSLRQLWMHASQSLIFNHLLSREVAFARRSMGTGGIPLSLLVVESLRKALSPSLPSSSSSSSACRLGTPNSVVLPLLGRLAYPQRLLQENDETTMELPMLLLEAAVSRFNASRDTCPGEDINSSSENAPFANAEANSSEISNHEEDNANAEREGNNVQVEVPSVVNAQSSDKCPSAVVVAVAPRNACEWLTTVLRDDVKLDPAVFFFTNLSNRVAAINGDNDGQYHHHHRSFDMVSHIASQRAARAAQEVAGVSLLPHARTALAIATDVSVDLIESHYYRHSATAERKVEERGVTNKEKEEAEDDEKDRSVLRLSISFTLPSAAYATVFLMHLLGQIPN